MTREIDYVPGRSVLQRQLTEAIAGYLFRLGRQDTLSNIEVSVDVWSSKTENLEVRFFYSTKTGKLVTNPYRGRYMTWEKAESDIPKMIEYFQIPAMLLAGDIGSKLGLPMPTVKTVYGGFHVRLHNRHILHVATEEASSDEFLALCSLMATLPADSDHGVSGASQ